MRNIIAQINKSALKFLDTLILDDTYRVIIQEAMDLLDAHYGSIFLEEDGVLIRKYASIPELFKTDIRKRGYTYTSFKHSESFVVHKESTSHIHENVEQLGINSTIFIPLIHGSESIGVISIDSKKERDFTENQLTTMKLFGSLATLAIIKAQTYESQIKALQLRDRFIAMASHELRTPLTSVTGYAALIKTRAIKGQVTPLEWCEKLEVEIDRLTTILTELLDLNNIKNGKVSYSFEEVHITNIILSAVSTMNKIYTNREIVVENKMQNDTVVGDMYKLTQVFTNIIENAIKFSRDDSAVFIKLHSNEQNVYIEFIDEGIGIKPKDTPHVFEEHFQADGSEHEGMGIGLFLAKNVITRHKGLISISSKYQKGTTVKIQLPLIHYVR